MSTLKNDVEITVREARPDDADRCGEICYEAFATINREHGFAPEFPSAGVAASILSMMFAHPGFYALVAERRGEIVGSNVLDERSAIAGVGPITIDPAAQDRGVGRELMEAVLRRSAERGFPGVRLIQSAFHNRSLSLYTKLGFAVQEPLAVMNGSQTGDAPHDRRVRGATEADAERCNALCRRVHGHDRAGELRDAIAQGTPVVVERDDRITGYATVLGYFGHTVGEEHSDVTALIAHAREFAGPGILVPTRNSALFRWCLERGLRVVQPMTLMTLGLYNEPNGAYLPSILY
jgi:GNAT superfamily N-acetyltransferase